MENFTYSFWRCEPEAIDWAMKTKKRAEIRAQANIPDTDHGVTDDNTGDEAKPRAGWTLQESVVSIKKLWDETIASHQATPLSTVNHVVPSADRVCRP